MKMNKEEIKGITLIALVITIIVLLILAGVTISLTLGENGIFKIAETSVEKQKIAEYEEKIELSKSKALGENKGTITIDDLINQIYKDDIVPEGSIKKIDEEKVSLITKEGHEFIITTTKTEYIGINEVPKINIANIAPYGFIIQVKDNYSDNFVQEYKYYLNEKLVYSGTNENSYQVIGLNEGTNYRVYVEVFTNDEVIKTNVVDVTTQTVVSGIKLNGNAEIITNLAQSDIFKTANDEYTIAMRVKINRQEQATMNYMGLWGYHEWDQGTACQFIGTETTLGISISIDYTPYYDKWTDITATYNNGNAKIYFNSKLMGTVNINITPYSSFVIGNSYVETIGNRKMKGEISSVKVWSKGLTEDEIISLDMGGKNTRNTERIY